MRHERLCDCSHCIGKRNRASGLRKQRDAQKVLYRALEVPMPEGPAIAHEETWDLPIAVEVKSGKQVHAAWARWRAIEDDHQLWLNGAARRSAYGIHFVVAIADNPTVVAFRLSSFASLIDNWPLGAMILETSCLHGSKIVPKPIATFWNRGSSQAQRNQSANKPVAVVGMPRGTTDGLLIMHQSTIQQLHNRIPKQQGDFAE